MKTADDKKKPKRSFGIFILVTFSSCLVGMLTYQFYTSQEFNSYAFVADVVGSSAVTAALAYVFYHYFE